MPKQRFLKKEHDMQRPLLDDFSMQAEIDQGRQLRDLAIQQAMDHADSIDGTWSKGAFLFLLKYIQSNGQFTSEEMRIASTGVVSDPPDPRAWGGVMMRAARIGLIKKIGVKQGILRDCHRANKTVWEVSRALVPAKKKAARVPMMKKVQFTLDDMVECHAAGKKGDSVNVFFKDKYGIDLK